MEIFVHIYNNIDRKRRKKSFIPYYCAFYQSHTWSQSRIIVWHFNWFKACVTTSIAEPPNDCICLIRMPRKSLCCVRIFPTKYHSSNDIKTTLIFVHNNQKKTLNEKICDSTKPHQPLSNSHKLVVAITG